MMFQFIKNTTAAGLISLVAFAAVPVTCIVVMTILSEDAFNRPRQIGGIQSITPAM